MNWDDLLNTTRLMDSAYVQRPGRPMYVQDMDRIIFSAPFRRLANKTQVHPLYDNDHIHQRLIHSIEVSSVGRSLGTGVGQLLLEQGRVSEEQRDVMAGVVQAACLAHDIGNPPFGHSGEAAIGSWFAERLSEGRGVMGDLDPLHHREFQKFEGNAQGFRIISRNEMYTDEGGMRLSLAVLGAFMKYPATARVSEAAAAQTTYCGLKKYGMFENDLASFEAVADALRLPEETSAAGKWWRRHPLVFLMEAADDICYNVMDLEDAFISGDIDYDLAKTLLSSLFQTENRGSVRRSRGGEIAYLRARAINGAISACVEAFAANYEALMSGAFSGALIDVSSRRAEIAEIKTISRDRVYTAPRKTELEILGRNVLWRILNGLAPLLDDLARNGWDPERASSYHRQLIRTFGLEFDAVSGPYEAMHVLTDFVSGMTDRYAVKVADMLRA